MYILDHLAEFHMPEEPDCASPTVFISYSRDSSEHESRVLELADRLRSDGIDATLDQYEGNGPVEGWNRWMTRHLRDDDFVILICTEPYYRRVIGEEAPGQGRGGTWEGNLILQHLNEDDSRNMRFLPVLLEGGKPENIPDPFRAFGYFNLGANDGYDKLYRQLTNQPELTAPQLGKRRALPRRTRPRFPPATGSGGKSLGPVTNSPTISEEPIDRVAHLQAPPSPKPRKHRGMAGSSRKHLLMFGLLALCAFVCGLLILIAGKSDRMVTGYVSYENGDPAADVLVTVDKLQTKTDKAGRYEFSVPGDETQTDLTLQAIRDGYETYRTSIAPGVVSGEGRIILRRKQ